LLAVSFAYLLYYIIWYLIIQYVRSYTELHKNLHTKCSKPVFALSNEKLLIKVNSL
jgi:hypothetical protein